MRADDALGELLPSDAKSTALAEAVEWLRDQLRDGPQPAKTVKESAESDGIKARTLDRAKRELEVVATRDGFGGPWVWKLPNSQSAPSESEVRQANGVAHYEDFGALRDLDAYADALGAEADRRGAGAEADPDAETKGGDSP